MMDIKLEEQKTQPTLLVKHVAKQREMGSLLGQSFGMVGAYLGELKEPPAGPPFVVYYNLDEEKLEVEMGFPVAKELPGKDAIVYKMLPEGRAATCIHKGPYQDLHVTYEAMAKWIQDNNYEPAYLVYEQYLNSAMEVPETELLTKIVMYIK